MYQFMRKYNKKLLAVAMVFLMIAFVMPQFSKSDRTPAEFVIGKLGSQNVTAADVQNARAMWIMLKQNILVPTMQQGQAGYNPLAMYLGDQFTIQQIDTHEPMFYLLQQEAKSMGVSVSQREIDAYLAQLNVRLEDGRIVLASLDNLGEERFEMISQAVHDFLMVAGARDRAASVIKISQPMIDNRLATEMQEIRLQLIAFDAKDYLPRVPTPTPEALQKQFEKYADVLPVELNPNTTDPSGFGYKFPDRVKLQYVSIARDQAVAAVKASKSEYDWEVEAQRYYKKNLSLFPVTQPTSRPSDPLTLDANSKAPTTGPTTKRFTEVRASIINALVEPLVDQLIAQVAAKITATMGSDFGTYRLATAAGAVPTTAPVTSLGVPFDSFEYLQKLALDVQKEFKLLPTVASLGESFLNAEQLQKLPGIGSTFAQARQQQFLPFATYAIQLAAPLHPKRDDALRLFELSRPLMGIDGAATYFFRLTATDPAHRPASLSEVADAVTRDVKLTDSMKLARASAEEALVASKTSGIRQAAIAAGKTPIETGFFGSAPGRAISGFEVAENSRTAFVDGAFALLTEAVKSPQSPPASIIELPREGRVLLAQLSDVRSEIESAQIAMARTAVQNQLTGQFQRTLIDRWFAYDDLANRMNFHDEGRSGKRPATAPSDEGSAG